ncbi:hypothetical protein RS82_00786 [Microbacterium trichothecenolyticum]|uniref:Uncharacterized protein n=1 Tax=Microbacterium trichothecenolyticum TaxID=69370 RepID=A0A0M2HCW2_MICTR|nr:hypothetical protein RS82_00786 [Microbacterium trichothecenolyticum]
MQHVDGALDPRFDESLELGSRDAHGRSRATQEDRDGGLGVERERLLCFDALASQRRERDARLGIGSEVRRREAGGGDRMAHHEIVEVRAPEVGDARRRSDDLQRAVRRGAHQRRIEGAAAQVVHRQHAVAVERGRGVVVPRRRDRLGDERHRARHLGGQGGHDEAAAVVAPRHRDGGDDRVGVAPFAFGDGLDHPRHHACEQLFGREPAAGDHHRHVVADPALELAHEPFGLCEPASLSSLAVQQGVVGDEHRRRRAVRLSPQREPRRLDVSFCICHRCGCGSPTGADVHSERETLRHRPKIPRFRTQPPMTSGLPPRLTFCERGLRSVAMSPGAAGWAG